MTEERTLLVELYRQMLLIRRFEEAAAKAYSQGKIGGFLHLYIGQEACAVGVLGALKATDYVITTYRDHAQALARGTTPRACMAELFGKVTGCSKGLGGSMHFFDAENRFLGGHGIVGGHAPLAAGAAFASKYRNDGNVTVCFFGDGSATMGAFHEALAMSSLWKLPIVFICENNEYSMGTPLSRSLSVVDVSAKAPAFGVERDRFRATNVLEVRERTLVAVERARSTGMPTLMEIQTYRYRGHSMSDPGKYRTPEEVEERKKTDCLHDSETRLRAFGMSDEDLTAINVEIDVVVEDCVKFADESAEPDESLIEAFTYA